LRRNRPPLLHPDRPHVGCKPPRIRLYGRRAALGGIGQVGIAKAIDEIIAAGATSHNAIAGKLNERNVRTARGGAWTHVQVGAILHPFGGTEGASVAA
jgi:hypothetical protein